MTGHDLDRRLAKWQPVKMPFDASGLDPREVRMVEKLVEASQWLDCIFWRQSDPEALALFKSSTDPKLRQLLVIHGSRFDLIDEHRPFTGTEPMPPGRGLYPKGLTREQIEEYVRQHPGKKEEVYSTHTVIERHGDELAGRPYHEVYKAFLEPMTKALCEAAALSDDEAFAEFLRKRADDLLVDDYYQSDLLWIDLKAPKFDVVFAPYETYLDDVLGVKASYGAAVLIRNDTESKRLAEYQQYVPDIQDALQLPSEDLPSKRGHVTPMEVMDAPFRTGDLLHGYQSVADNLPNDARVHEAKGSKKIFFRNFMDARVNVVILPIARRLFREDQARRASGNGYLASTLAHEISHELGPNYSRTAAGQKDIREAIGGDFAALEEAKADVVGMFCLKWLADHGAITKDQLSEDYISYVAGNFRTIRFGIAEPHGRGEMMEFSYLLER